MTEELAERHGAQWKPLARVVPLATSDDDFGELARYLSGDSCSTFEQDPRTHWSWRSEQTVYRRGDR
ncbi:MULTISPECIES: hypothetical protein [unclassified Bradyrhizobium]|uniref:hypothetical protein n=1 Tax=unclassified Bradyrhizobium TaxID=2631580 RepID=UPI00339AAD59